MTLLSPSNVVVVAFTPLSSTSVSRRRCLSSSSSSSSFDMSVNPLEEVNTSKENDDPFDRYEQSQQQTTVAIKDRVEGTGMLVEGDGQLLTVAYKGRFMESGKQFDQSDNFVCRIGRNSVLPGFEDGLRGMRVGGLRTIRIPPNKAYGDEWYKGTIPPSSHLEFDLELKNIAQTPQEEFQVQLEKFGVGRAIGGAIIIAYLAVSPFLT